MSTEVPGWIKLRTNLKHELILSNSFDGLCRVVAVNDDAVDLPVVGTLDGSREILKIDLLIDMGAKLFLDGLQLLLTCL